MKAVLTIAFLVMVFEALTAQTVKYSTAWFGPNANPVPEFTDACIPQYSTITLSSDYYFGFGDQTTNLNARLEIPLLPERISFVIWLTCLERYSVTPEVNADRGMPEGVFEGNAAGDFYVQTRITILKNKAIMPDIILNSTIKTASGTNFPERRYFDTPGYFFNLEIAKSLSTGMKFINEVRFVSNIGFLCWQTDSSMQDDAWLYGLKTIAGNNRWNLECSLSGYHGWMHTSPAYGPDYGDAPVVFATRLNLFKWTSSFFTQYQVGLNDFPFHQLRLGVSISMEKLTPRY